MACSPLEIERDRQARLAAAARAADVLPDPAILASADGATDGRTTSSAPADQQQQRHQRE